MIRIDGKVALVTGGGGGIGRGICEVLAQAGAKVIVTGRNLGTVDETVKIITDAGGEAFAVKLDVSSEPDWLRAVDTTLTRFNKLNILVNNAGIYTDEGCEGTSLAHWRYALGINLDGTFLGVRTAIAAMKDNNEANSIINISSVAGQIPDLSVLYSVSKAGVGMLGKCAALECIEKGYDNIRVNTILPGVIKDGMGNEDKETQRYQQLFAKYLPPSRLGDAKEIASAVLFLASEQSAYTTGSELVIDGGLSAGAGGYLVARFSEAVIN